VFTLSSVLLNEYQKLLIALQRSQSYTPPFADINNTLKDHFEICVKRIGQFSTFLHNIKTSSAGETHEFQLRGLFVFPFLNLNDVE
jgi:hypothetical protein